MPTLQKRRTHILKWVLPAVVLLLIITILAFRPMEPEPDISTSTTISGSGSALIPNPFKAEDFTYDEKGFMTCLAAESWLGIDVSYHQKTIRWQEVADSGVQFAMIRLGNRTVREGSVCLDSRWEEYYQGATAAGLKVGAYFYSQAISAEEARQEALFVLEVLEGRTLDMPVVFDWEIFDENGRTANVDRQTLTECAIAFCETISEAGYQPMIYFNLDWATRLWDLEQMQSLGYPFWLALYRQSISWPYRVQMWQYTASGAVPGIDTKVDLNLFFRYE